jgi:hypothetical protein
VSRIWSLLFLGVVVLAGISSLHGLGQAGLMGAGTTATNSSYSSSSSPSSASLRLSPYWPDSISRWRNQIYKVAYVYGLDPDLVAAVVYAESRGQADVTSHAGAVGLMGVMPYGPGLEWRPTAEQLRDPETNLRWGTSILADILRQTGGDAFAALAAYNGGWRQANQAYTRAYATEVLNQYAQAVVVRAGGEPTDAGAWTIAIEKTRGHVAPEPYLVLGDLPAASNLLIGEHVLYQAIDRRGTVYYVKGYAVPLKLPPTTAQTTSSPMPQLSGEAADLMARDKTRQRAPMVLLACLPSLQRLRGQVGSRWFEPSACMPPTPTPTPLTEE